LEQNRTSRLLKKRTGKTARFLGILIKSMLLTGTKQSFTLLKKRTAQTARFFGILIKSMPSIGAK
jgi:hypothetical protein